MATQTITYTPKLTYSPSIKTFVRGCVVTVKRFIPRPRRILSFGLLLAGLGIPFLMVCEIIPASLFVGLVGLAAMTVGGVLSLIHYAEL